MNPDFTYCPQCDSCNQGYEYYECDHHEFDPPADDQYENVYPQSPRWLEATVFVINGAFLLFVIWIAIHQGWTW